MAVRMPARRGFRRAPPLPIPRTARRGRWPLVLSLPPHARFPPKFAAELVQLRPVRPVQVDQQEGLVGPVDEAPRGHTRVQDDIHQVHGGEVLHVLDAFLGEPCLIPEVEPIELVEGYSEVIGGTTRRSALDVTRCRN